MFLYVKWVTALKIGILRRAKDGVYILELNIYNHSLSVWAELERIVSNNQFYKNGLAPRNAKVLKCTLIVDEGIVFSVSITNINTAIW